MPPNNPRLPGIIISSLLVTLFFLSYVALTSSLIIFHDSIGYQELAKTFAQGHWKEFFISGPNREPLYPLVIAFAMTVARWLGMNALAVTILIQILLLITTQLMTYRLLKKLKVSDAIAAVTLLYMGLSPAFVSSGLILFSEVITYPLILWLIFSLANSWDGLRSDSKAQCIEKGLRIAVPALLLTLTKGAFEPIIPLALTPFLWKAFLAWRQRNSTILMNSACVILSVFCFFQLPLVIYKSANRHFNGVYALTDRGPEALYGNTARRMQPLTGERLVTSLAYMLGPDVCSELYGEKCLAWGFLTSDVLGANKVAALREKGFSRQDINRICVQESIPLVFKNPLQYIFLALIEGAKVFLWEHPEISYVVYCDQIDNFYNDPRLRFPLRFIIALAGAWAFLGSFKRLWADRGAIFSLDGPHNGQPTHHMFITITVLIFIVVHSAFFILPRYALSIAPLLITLIAWRGDMIFKTLAQGHDRTNAASLDRT